MSEKPFILLCFLLVFVFPSEPSFSQTSQCTVVQILETKTVPTGTLAIDAYGSLTEISHILVPTTIEKGRYEVMITRKKSNLYEAPNHGLYLKTSACFKMATMRTVIFEVPESETSAGILYFSF